MFANAHCEPVTVHLALNCGFLMDQCGRAVDGDHVRRPGDGAKGNLPTGDGVPGGTFESWFTLAHGKGESR